MGIFFLIVCRFNLIMNFLFVLMFVWLIVLMMCVWIIVVSSCKSCWLFGIVFFLIWLMKWRVVGYLMLFLIGRGKNVCLILWLILRSINWRLYCLIFFCWVGRLLNFGKMGCLSFIWVGRIFLIFGRIILFWVVMIFLVIILMFLWCGGLFLAVICMLVCGIRFSKLILKFLYVFI